MKHNIQDNMLLIKEVKSKDMFQKVQPGGFMVCLLCYSATVSFLYHLLGRVLMQHEKKPSLLIVIELNRKQDMCPKICYWIYQCIYRAMQ
jgi:hypothetical protein